LEICITIGNWCHIKIYNISNDVFLKMQENCTSIYLEEKRRGGRPQIQHTPHHQKIKNIDTPAETKRQPSNTVASG